MARKNDAYAARHHTKHRWNTPDGWSDSDIFGYDTSQTPEDDEIAEEVMEELFPNPDLAKKGIVKITIKK